MIPYQNDSSPIPFPTPAPILFQPMPYLCASKPYVVTLPNWTIDKELVFHRITGATSDISLYQIFRYLIHFYTITFPIPTFQHVQNWQYNSSNGIAFFSPAKIQS